MLDWIIVGGGPHGTHLAVALTQALRVPADRVVLLDPHPTPLRRWWQCVANTGMRYLRSPSVHHLALDPFDLRQHARDHGFGPEHWTDPYDRPSVALFRHHCETLEDRRGVARLRQQGSARRLRLTPQGVAVETDRGDLEARQVLLATGMSDQPAIPDWVAGLVARAPDAPVRHVFDPSFDLHAVRPGAHVVVIGGGITAAQAATHLLPTAASVRVIARHAPRSHDFDADPGWMGPKNMRTFYATPDPAARRRLILQARNRGSLSDDMFKAVRASIQRGRLTWTVAEVQRAAPLAGGGVALHTDQGPFPADVVLLATGNRPHRPGGALVDALVDEWGLRCAACGYPLVGPDLRWHPRVVVTGALAELELGPVARNFAGARRAGERLAA